jgi:hypothetical protein
VYTWQYLTRVAMVDNLEEDTKEHYSKKRGK